MSAATRSMTDSPWFWACVFAVAGLIGLSAIGPKYSQRQAQIEREFQGRQRAAQNAQGQAPSVPLSTPDQTLISLRPLFLGLAAVIAIAWFIFWRRQTTLNQSLTPDH
jgi:hypothetical protein